MAYVIALLVLAAVLVGSAAAVLTAIARLDEILAPPGDIEATDDQSTQRARRPTRTPPVIRRLMR